jgi:hypothetical protein
MTLILKEFLPMVGAESPFSSTPAAIELHDDHFILATTENNPNPSTIVMNVPLSELKVGGSMALMTFTVGDLKRRVDFSQAAGGGPGYRYIRSAKVMDATGITLWLNEFRARGVEVKHVSIRNSWTAGVGLAVLIGIGAFVYAYFQVNGGS